MNSQHSSRPDSRTNGSRPDSRTNCWQPESRRISHGCTRRYGKVFSCVNCGRTGHGFKECWEPITSFGIIAIRRNHPKIKKGPILKQPKRLCALHKDHVPDSVPEPVEDHSSILYLLVKRKDSMGNVDAIRQKFGQYEQDPNKHEEMLRVYLSEMTCEERERIRDLPFADLWSDLWINHSSKSFLNEYGEAKTKFERFDMERLVKETSCQWTEQEYGFPKGRKRIFETDKECALREFKEEAGYGLHEIRLLYERPYEEVFTGTNGIRYRHVYFIAEVPLHVGMPRIDSANLQQAGEISDVGWFTYEQCMAIFRPYDTAKKALLVKLHEKVKNRYVPRPEKSGP